jgi:hypothetical protein
MPIEVISNSAPEEKTQADKSGQKSEGSGKEETKSASSEQQDEITEESDSSEADESSEGDESEAESDDESDAAKEGEQKPKKKNGFKKRIDKLNQRLSVKDQELEYWKQKALKGDSRQEPQPKETPKKEAQNEGRPNSSEFETHEDYVEAVADWKYEQRKSAEEAKARESQLKTDYQKQLGSHQARVGEFAKKTPDFQDVIDDFNEEHADFKLSTALEEVIITSDMGPAVLYDLAKNKAELDRINALGFAAVGREIGKIEARLEKSSEPTETKKQTKTPPPLKPLGNGSARVAKSIYDPSLSQSEYESLRREQMRKKA